MADPKLSDLQIEERAASAKALLNDPIVAEALDAMRFRYIESLIGAEVGSVVSHNAHSKLKVLQDFRTEVGSMITDHAMRKRFSGKA